jgi:galactonate dehydratase
MNISAIDVFPVREPKSGRSYTLLKLSTREGPVGWGETTSISPAALSRARSVVIGQPATRYDMLTRQFAGEAIGGALNMALLDITGQVMKVPAFQVLGGPTRNKVRAIAAAATPAARQTLAAQGHRAFLAPLDMPAGITSRPKIVAGIVEQYTRLRKDLGEGFDFAADGQGRLPALEATDVAVALEPLHPLWFEQPCREASHDVLARISDECATPLGLGNELREISPVQNLLRAGIVDVVRLPLAHFGITPIRRAAAVAETYYVAVAPSLPSGGPVATAAALQLAASLPNFFIQEIPPVTEREDRQMREELVGGAIETVRDGFLALSTKPGLGITVNENIIRRMAQ